MQALVPLQPLQPSHLPLEHLVGPLVAQNLGKRDASKLERKDVDEIDKVIQRTRNGDIRVRAFSRPNTIIAITLLFLAAVTLYSMIVMDYGKVNFGEAVLAALDDFFTMMLEPSLEPHLNMGRIFFGVLISLALAVLTTFIGAVFAFVLGLLASARLWLGAHTPMQVSAGFIGGFAVAGLAMIFV